jgi:hypothetical protein
MRDTHFDFLTRALDQTVSRRSTLGVLGIAASLLTLDAADARNRKHRRRRRRKSQRRRRRRNRSQVCKRAGNRSCDVSAVAPGQDLSKCNLANGPLVWASLAGGKANRANLSEAHLLGAELDGTDLSRACLAGASLRHASLRGANLDGADLSGADLCGADLRGARISSKQLASASVCCSTRLPDGSSAAPCPQGRTCCGDGCTDLSISNANCGACGNTCPSGQVCCEGTCVTPGVGQRCSTPDPLCIPPNQDLQEVIDQAEDNSTIYLCSGTWGLTETILISKNLTILGSLESFQPTSVLDGRNIFQVVGIRPTATVEFQNVSFINGLTDEGGGIFNQGYLTLYGCTLEQNLARLGGGIYNEGTLRVYRSSFSKNQARQSSDPFDPVYRGGALYNDEGTVVIETTTFTDNTANDESMDYGEGGAILNYYGQVTLGSGAILNNNHAEAWGGAIYNDGGKLAVQAGVSITTNAAGYSGGGIYADGGSSDITPGTVTGNNPDNCNGTLNTKCQ